jgi:hypothetical protein
LNEQLRNYKNVKEEKEGLEKQLALNQTILDSIRSKNEELEAKLNVSQMQIQNYKVCQINN